MSLLGYIKRPLGIFGRVLGVRILQKRGRGQQRMAFIKQTWRDVFMHTYLELKRAVGEWESGRLQ